jgi:hypothetical protein
MTSTSTKLCAFRLDLHLIDGLEQVKQKTGAPIAEQVRRALRAWLTSHGVIAQTPKPKRKRVTVGRRR